MKINEIQAMLLAAARALPPDEHVPYSFERRVMALLGAEPAPDPWALWSLVALARCSALRGDHGGARRLDGCGRAFE